MDTRAFIDTAKEKSQMDFGLITGDSLFRASWRYRQKCPSRSWKTIAFSDLQIIRCIKRPSKVRSAEADLVRSCRARWSFVISRKLIYEFLGLREKRDKREKGLILLFTQPSKWSQAFLWSAGFLWSLCPAEATDQAPGLFPGFGVRRKAAQCHRL